VNAATTGWTPEEMAALRELQERSGRVTTEPLGPAPGEHIPEAVYGRLAMSTADLFDEFLHVIPLENHTARRRVAAAFGDLMELLMEDV
jgi:hypothetical protein